MTFYIKKTVYADVAVVSVKWQGVQLSQSERPFQTLFEAGQTYTRKEWAYFAAGPVGNYTVTMKFVNEFGNVFTCYQLQIYLRPKKTLADPVLI